MNYVAPLKTFDAEDLLNLLEACAQNLTLAYQQTQAEALFYTSEQARDACDYLHYELNKEMPSKLIH